AGDGGGNCRDIRLPGLGRIVVHDGTGGIRGRRYEPVRFCRPVEERGHINWIPAFAGMTRTLMKLLRYGAPGREKPGLADKDGNIRDLSKVITQIDDAMLSPRNLARLARVKPETLPIVRGS